MVGLGKGLVVLAITTLLLSIIVGNSWQYGRYAAIFVGLLALFVHFRPIPQLWISSRFTSSLMLATAVLLGLTTIQAEKREAEAAAVEREVELQKLKATDSKAYLAMLNSSHDPRWETELASLDRPAYEALIRDRKAQEEAAREAEVGNLKDEAGRLSPAEISRAYTVYARLNELEPSVEHRTKKDHFLKQLQMRNRQEDQARNPERFVSIEKFSWNKGAFDTVMLADFTIRNSLDWPVKDIEVVCRHTAPSGTEIDSNKRVIYQRIEPGKSKRISGFSMGFVHSQAQRSGCNVSRVVVIR